MLRALLAIGIAAASVPQAWGAASSINYAVPQNFGSASRASNGAVSPAAWNINGTRCTYLSVSSNQWTNQGFSLSSGTFVPVGATTPVMTMYADGVARAVATATYQGDDGFYAAYAASLSTKCVGGPNNGLACNADSACPSGACVTCDQTNTCSTSGTVSAPCVTNTCTSGTSIGAICTTNADCTGSGTCSAVTYPSGVGTCYLQQKCVTAGSGTLCQSTGFKDTGTGGGPFHSALAVVRTGGIYLGSNEKITRYVSGNSGNSFSTCSTNCDGGIDASSGTLNAIVCEH